MSAASQLLDVLNKLLIKDGDAASYTSVATQICNHLMEDLKKADDHFREAFDGLSLTGSYLDRTKLKTPDEFDMHMKLKLPFHQLSPVRDSQRDGFVFLRVYTGGSHPAIVNGYVNRKSLQDWIRKAFHEVFKKYTALWINGDLYKLSYELEGYGCAHTIEATSSSKTISFDFVPVFEFSSSKWPLPDPSVYPSVMQNWPWFAVPQHKSPADDRTFMVCAPHWEREMMKGNDNMKNVLRLMKGIRDKHCDSLRVTSYMLKTVILLQLEKRSDGFWRQDLYTLLKEMWTALVHHFEIENLPFYLAKGCNHFDRIKNERERSKQTAKLILQKIQSGRIDQIF